MGTGLGSTPQSAVADHAGRGRPKGALRRRCSGPARRESDRLPHAPGTPDGCYVPLVVTYGTQSVTSFLSKTSDGLPCHHPFQLSVAAMTQLDMAVPLKPARSACDRHRGRIAGSCIASGERAGCGTVFERLPDGRLLRRDHEHASAPTIAVRVRSVERAFRLILRGLRYDQRSAP